MLPLTAQLNLSNTKAKSVGLYGEIVARALFESAGYVVSHHKEKTFRGDLCVVDPTGVFHNIEVKTSRRGSNGYQFCMKRDARTVGGKCLTDCAYSDYVLLLAVSESGSTEAQFLIPVSEIKVKKLAISDLSKGKYAKFRLDDIRSIAL